MNHNARLGKKLNSSLSFGQDNVLQCSSMLFLPRAIACLSELKIQLQIKFFAWNLTHYWPKEI